MALGCHTSLKEFLVDVYDVGHSVKRVREVKEDVKEWKSQKD